jgi:hypothetical protein
MAEDRGARLTARADLVAALIALVACEPKRLRYRLPHVAGRLTRHARRLTLHLPADWPWAAALARAVQRLDALPAFGSGSSGDLHLNPLQPAATGRLLMNRG